MNSVPLNNKYAPNIRPKSSEVESQKRPFQVQDPFFHRIMDNIFVLEREGTAAKISQVAEGVLILLILCTVIGGLICIGTCYAIDRFSTPSRLDEAIDYEYGERRGQVPFSLESFVNNQTVMSGASKSWGESRIIDGKLALYKKMGAESVRLNTRTGDQIHGCYFGAEAFNQVIKENGGSFVEFSLEHEFLKATPVKLQSMTSNKVHHGVIISKTAALDKEFQDFCLENEYHFIEKIELFEENKIILVKGSSFLNEQISDYKIESSLTYPFRFELFDPKYQKNICLVCDQKLSRKSKIDFYNFGLSDFVLFQGENIFCSFEMASSLQMIDEFKKNYSFLEIKRSDLSPQRDKLKNSAICLSLHQTTSMFGMYKEILSHLVSGFNVFVYDNAGKGLSRGLNTEKGMTEAVRASGEFLKIEKQFPEERIVFKGQCAGALPTSESAKLFPQSHIWIDQAPRTYSDRNMISNLLGDRIFNNWLVSLLLAAIWKLFAPSYNIIDNLREGGGLQLYTIGVPNESGRGGDYLVPDNQTEEFENYLDGRDSGHYLTMKGATHVSGVWNYPIYEKIQQLFRERLSSE